MSKNHSPDCIIKFNDHPGNTHISQILTGYKMLENSKMLKIKSITPYKSFRTDGNYEHNSIVEVEIDGKLIAYDMADGYQSIHRKDVFDSQLERLNVYFKRSYDSSFHSQMKNKNKVKSLGLNYLCSCKGNPYDNYHFDSFNFSSLKEYVVHQINKKKNVYDYSVFESNSVEYDNYNLLFLTRLWDSTGITVERIQGIYPYFSENEAKQEAEKWRYSLDIATQNRIGYIKELRNHFGDRIIAGVNNSDISRKLCPDFIVDDKITNRNNYIEMIKKNYVCITSEGLHHSIGWKFAEYVAAGKAILSEPLFYEVPYSFLKGKNYLEYSDVSSCIKQSEMLLDNVDMIHSMEKHNREYYYNHLRPDKLVYDSLKIAFPELFK